MLSKRVKQLAGPSDRLSQLIVAGGVGLLLGFTSLRFSPLWIFGALTGVGLVLIALKRPEIALLGILIATSSFIDVDSLPAIFGFETLIVDTVLAALFCVIVLRWLVEPTFRFIRTPLDLPLLAFYSMALLSSSIAILQGTVELWAAFLEFRTLSYYLILFIVTNLVREKHQLVLLVRGFFLLATLVAAVMVAQFLVGESVSLLPGRVETLITQGRSYGGVTRILPPGLSLVIVGFVTATVTLVLDRFKLISVLRFLQWGLLGLAVILTFLRSYWAAICILVSLLAYLARGQERQRLARWGLVIMLLATIILLLVLAKPESRAAKLVSASFARLGTLGRSETVGESSLKWRYIENEYALQQIASHPLLGSGLGARYRPWDPRLDWRNADGSGFDGRAFLHNGHLWIMMKSGLLGYLCLMWLSLVFLWRGFKYWRFIPDPQMRGIVLGFTLTYLGVLIAAVVNSTFVQWFWTPVIGIMMGVNEVALRKAIQERPCFGIDSWQVTRKEA
jgi:hypothetical protein